MYYLYTAGVVALHLSVLLHYISILNDDTLCEEQIAALQLISNSR
ncbi:hypothetical protein [Wielerella bovis]|nr:hypothetical protein [Wielerella bovis]